MASYNGHRSWNAWNVSLWISNDEGLYSLAKECKRTARTVGRAARMMKDSLAEMGITRTPDGAVYNDTCIREALRDL